MDTELRGERCKVDRSEDQFYRASLEKCTALMAQLDNCRAWKLHAEESEQGDVIRWRSDARTLKRYSKKEMVQRFVRLVDRLVMSKGWRLLPEELGVALDAHAVQQPPRFGAETACGRGVG